MKRIIFGLMLAMMFCTLMQGANRTVTENDGQGNKKRVIELRDTVINGETVTDTLSVMTYENGAGSSNAPEKWRTHHSSGMDWNGFDLGSKTSETVIAVTAIVFVFGLPLLIIFVVFFFRYKNRKAKYRLAEQALASGQQLPENFFKEAAATDIRSKGINNIFVGIGLFIFLWAITGEFGLGCIGLLVMFTGFGQLVIFYSQQKKNEEKMSQMGDISLVAQVVVFHNTRAFDQLVKKYQSPVRRFFLHQTCGDSELSDDLAQDTFIKAYTNIASFKNLSSFSTWLYRIAYNVFYDYIRSRKETDDLDTYRVDAQCSTLQQDVGQHMDIYRALATLKEMERTCITLFYMEDQSIEKIAGITGCPAGTVKSHLSRAKDKMASYLKQNGYDGK